jgi:predicted nucleotidyltransferase
MESGHPLRTVTPSLDGDVLAVLAGAEAEFTGRQLQRLVGTQSHRGVQLVLNRLVRQGVVTRRAAGRANLYALNRQHLAAPAIEALAHLRQTLVERLRELVAGWQVEPATAVIFGSVARGEDTPDSDLDLLLIRPAGVDADDGRWAEQLASLAEHASAWTGNDARIVDYGEDELAELSSESVLINAAREGIEFGGSLRRLQRTMRGQR